MHATQFTLPDLFASCPIDAAVNPHYEQVSRESRKWLESYDAFTSRKKAVISAGQFELLACHAYPYADYGQFRTCCDFISLLFLFDEISDDQTGEGAKSTGEKFINSLRDPNLNDGSKVARMAKDVRAQVLKYAGPNSAERFLQHCETYVKSVGIEAYLRERHGVLGIQKYIAHRRENSAVRVCFALVEMCLGIDLPNEVFEDPAFLKCYFAAVDHVGWANDVYSYAMELAKGCHEGNNILTVLMKSKGIPLQEASDFVGGYIKVLITEFTSVREVLPSFGQETDKAVKLFLDGAAAWMRGNLDWSFENERYFGPEHERIREHRVVQLTPQTAASEV